MPLLSKQCGLQLLPLVDILRRGRAARFPALGPEIFLIERIYADAVEYTAEGIAAVIQADVEEML